MICPTCKEIDLLITDRYGLEIDYCPQCRGVWLQRPVLEKILQGRPHPPRPATAPAEAPPVKRRRSWFERMLDF